MRIRFDHGPEGSECAFERPVEVISAREAADVPAALEAMDAARADGLWLAGFASYELGYALEPKLAPLMPARRRVPLVQFGVYEGFGPAAELPEPAGRLDHFVPLWSEARYKQAFDAVHAHICAGDFYQANLTFACRMEAVGTPGEIYAALNAVQPVRFGAMIEAEGLPAILSRSPELFFRTDGAGGIETKPMKGTQPRSDDAEEDARRCRFLMADEKNRAENLMIVDLLRNDLGRICEIGSIEVPELFTVESLATVHQMTSLIRGRMLEGTALSGVFRALFPCGSITGAPKVRAMQILAGLEDGARDVYCGTIGWAAPDGRSEFNVAIRSLLVEEGRATLNVGGGVVYDSTAASEYEEALWKARFARRLIADFA